MRPLAPTRRAIRTDPRLLAAAERIRQDLGATLVASDFQAGDILCLEVGRGDLLRTARYLRDTPDLSFDYLSSLSGVDMVTHVEVVYHLHSLPNKLSVRLRVKLDAKRPAVDSVFSVWPTANWQEREAFDLLGITFRGHPNLERILLAEDFVGHPLRRDYELPRRRRPRGGHRQDGGDGNE